MSNGRIEGVIKHYRSLFSLPSFRTVGLMTILACCFSGLLLSALIGLTVTTTIMCSLTLIVIALITAFLTSQIHMSERIINFRRSLFLSLIGVVIFGVTSYSYSLVVSLFIGSLKIDYSISVGATLYFALALLVFGAITKGNVFKKVLSALAGPFMMLVAIAYLTLACSVWRLLTIASHFFMLSVLVTMLLVLAFSVINKQAKEATGFTTLTLFRAFVANWLADEKKDLEELLSELGEDVKVKIQVVVFKSNHDVNGVFVVPNVHPGPFKNVGGSLLPTYLARAIRDQYGVVSVIFHGASTHSLDPTSYHECVKVMDAAISAIKEAKPAKRVSELVRKSADDRVLLTYQVLGVPLFFISSLSEGVEDVPLDMVTLLNDVVAKAGFSTCMVIDAHNRYETTRTLSLDRDLSAKVAEAARTLAENTPITTLDALEAYFTDARLKGIERRMGIGDAGLMFSALKIGDNLYGYLSIDGNNLITGLREQAIDLLKSLGYTDGEVCTTDTHSVTALISRKEYYAVGEAFDPQLLLNTLKEVARKAVNNLKPVTIHVGEKEITIRVVGAGTLAKICDVISKSVMISKRVIPLAIVAYLIVAFAYLLVML